MEQEYVYHLYYARYHGLEHLQPCLLMHSLSLPLFNLIVITFNQQVVIPHGFWIEDQIHTFRTYLSRILQIVHSLPLLSDKIFTLI